MKKPKPDFLAILQTLVGHEVDFIVVGGVCAVLHGAPIATFDLDVVHSREPDNIDRLMAALETLDAHYRVTAERRLKPSVSHLSSPGHQLLMTRFGPLDVLEEIGNGHEYNDLLNHNVELQIGKDLRIRLLSLETLIRIKEESPRDQDKAVLPILRRTLEQKSRP